MTNPYWSNYEAAIEEAAHKIDTDVRNCIGYAATKGNTQHPDETIVTKNATSAFEFFIGKLNEFYPDRSAESERHVTRFVNAMVDRIHGKPTVH